MKNICAAIADGSLSSIFSPALFITYFASWQWFFPFYNVFLHENHGINDHGPHNQHVNASISCLVSPHYAAIGITHS